MCLFTRDFKFIIICDAAEGKGLIALKFLGYVCDFKVKIHNENQLLIQTINV